METTLTDVTGVGPATERLLAEIGITSVESLAGARPGVLAAIRGIGPSRAEALKAAATALVATSVSDDSPPPETVEKVEKAERLRAEAKKLVKEARRLEKKAKSTKSKKKRKRRRQEAASLLARAKKKKLKAKKAESKTKAD